MKRYSELVKDHSITQQQYEQAVAAYQTAQKQLQVLVDQKNQASVQTGVVTSQSNATYQNIGVANSQLKQRQVDVENAKLNLSYTVITAKENGYVSKIPVQVGQFIQAGSQLFSIVLSNQKWVVANYKETQVEKMVEGQKVEIEIELQAKVIVIDCITISHLCTKTVTLTNDITTLTNIQIFTI